MSPLRMLLILAGAVVIGYALTVLCDRHAPGMPLQVQLPLLFLADAGGTYFWGLLLSVWGL